jgi:hypothetical protein
VDGCEVVVEFCLGEIEFDLVESFQRVAKVNQDEVALVAKLREESRPDRSVGIRAFKTFEHLDCVGGDAVTISFRRCAPRFPFEAEELVEEG